MIRVSVGVIWHQYDLRAILSDITSNRRPVMIISDESEVIES